MTATTSTSAAIDTEAIRSYLKDLYGEFGAGAFPVCYPFGDGFAVASRHNLDDPGWLAAAIASIIEHARTKNIFVQLNPVVQGLKGSNRGRTDQTVALSTLAADIDVGKPGTPPTIDVALAFVTSLSLKPSMLVCSGAGVSAYWLLKELLTLDNADEREEARQISAGWGAAINRDAAKHGWKFDTVADLPRVLRPAGTLNHKPKYGEPRPVEFIHQGGPRYNLHDFEEFIPGGTYTSDDAPPAPDEGQRELSEDTIHTLVSALLPSWRDGQRHPMALYVAGWLANNEIAEASAQVVVRRCSIAAGDKNTEAKVKVVRLTYEKLRSGQKPTGWLGLKDLMTPEALATVDAVFKTTIADWKSRVSPNGAHAPNDARDNPLDSPGIALADFGAYLPEHKYIYLPTGKMWDIGGINGAFPPIGDTKPSTIVDGRCPLHDITWAPGEPQIIEDKFLDQGGWLTKVGARVYNHYRAPRGMDGDPEQAGPWLDLLEKVYPADAWHLVDWLAHRVQRPAEKLNHAIVIGGAQGIGKDTILEPVRHAVGPQNFGDVSPTVLMGRFNAFQKSVILRVSELRDLGDKDRYGFYEHTKTLITSPPETLLVDEKNVKAYRVPNLVGVVFTTNHRTDGLYLPEDDRRHYVGWSDAESSDFDADFWTTFYTWLDAGGRDHVAAYLAAVDLSDFDAKAPPPKTNAFWDIVSAGRAPEDSELADAIEKLKNPHALTVSDIVGVVKDDYDFRAWLTDRKNRRQLPHRFEAAGYVATRSPSREDGRWVVNGKQQTIYARRELSIHDRIAAASKRAGQPW